MNFDQTQRQIQRCKRCFPRCCFWCLAPLMSVLVAGCGGDSGGRVGQNDDGMSAAPAACSASRLEALEAGMSATLSQTDSAVDFSFSVQRRDGRRYDYNRGSSTLQTIYQSASTSKLVAAVMILRLVDQGYLNLADRPQDRIQTWPILSTDALYGMTLAHLLSLTSGLNDEPSCVSAGTPDLETCVVNTPTTMQAGTSLPDNNFSTPTHIIRSRVSWRPGRGVLQAGKTCSRNSKRRPACLRDPPSTSLLGPIPKLPGVCWRPARNTWNF